MLRHTEELLKDRLLVSLGARNQTVNQKSVNGSTPYNESAVTPLAGVVPGYATAPALLFVACLMLRDLTEVQWDETTEAIPAVVTALMMPFTYSIANGLAFGFITYAVLKLCTGKVKEVHWIMWVIAALFLFKFIYVGGH